MLGQLLRSTVAAAVVTAVLFTFDAQAQVTVSFALISEQTLPAIPVDFRITVSSASSQPFTIENGAALEVTTESGEKFLARWGGRDVVFASLAPPTKGLPTPVVIPPGTSRDFFHTADCTLMTQEYFGDWHLSMPGRYSLRVAVLPQGVSGFESAEVLWSNSVSLTVQQPQGDDAAVWQMLTAITAAKDRKGFSAEDWANENPPAIAEDVYAKYPRSHYVPYLACWKAATPAGRLQNIEAALALNPTGPLADRLKLTAAAVHNGIADVKRSMLDSDGAIAELMIARQIAQDVQASSVYPYLREEAKRFAEHLKTDDDVRQNVIDLTNARRTSPYPQVIPFVDCVSIQHDGGIAARFGYRNIKEQTETIPEGESNSIDPSDAAKNLPTTFRSGTRKNAFRATSSGGPITWRVLSFQATASKTSAPCKGN